MAGVINTATSSLAAYQKALDVIANNIANANTPGYSRQTVNFTPKPSQGSSEGFIGSGVDILDIERHSNQFVNAQVRNTLASFAEHDALYTQALEIDRLLSQQGTSISGSIQEFMNALAQANELPDSAAARGVLFNQSSFMVNQFKSMQENLGEIEHNVSNQAVLIVDQMNEIAAAIADINNQVISGIGTAPDLLDKRDQLLKELSAFTEVRTSLQSDGVMNVSIGKGEVLVIGGDSVPLSIGTNVSVAGGLDIFIGAGAGKISITQNIQGGELGGLFSFKQNILDPTSQTLGQMAIGLSLFMNQQHQLGIDMNNQVGKSLFTDLNSNEIQLSRVSASDTNSGSATLSVSITDINQTQVSDYELSIVDTGTNTVQITRISDGFSQAYSYTSNPPAPPAASLTVDGMTITVDDTANLSNNDLYILSPTKGAAANLDFTLNNPSEFALASPVRVEAAINNTGQGDIKLQQVLSTSTNAINKEYRIDFISDTQYNLVNVSDSTTTGPLAFTPNSDNTVSIPDAVTPAYTIVLSGIPKSGDSFSASFNSGGIGDNTNGLLLSDFQNAKTFMGGNESIFERYSSLIADVGGKTFQAQMRQESANILHQQAMDKRNSISGVNLDEEAANLLRFQQAYQAAGQVLSVTKQLMDVLFSTFR